LHRWFLRRVRKWLSQSDTLIVTTTTITTIIIMIMAATTRP